jgi:legumain
MHFRTKKVPGNCLGDLFSVNWMEDSDKVFDLPLPSINSEFFKENLRSETLATQFGIVRRKTTKSHVLNFGNFAIEEEYVGEFMGEKDSRVRMGDNRVRN